MNTTRLYLLAAALLATTLSPADADARRGQFQLKEKCSAAPLPDGLIKQITMIADGVVADPNEMLLDPTPIWTDDFGWSPAYIADYRSDALDFFQSKFGLDGEALMAEGRAVFMPFYFSPDIAYRAISVSGESVGSEGWQLIDTGWTLMVTDPNGIILPPEAGTFAGVNMTPGAFLLFGEYHLRATDVQDRCPRRYNPDPITIHYESGCPIIPGMMGVVTFICDLSHPEWGPGIAAGVSIPHPTPEGGIRFDNRNIITFPPQKAVD